jgi:hypothetical protein
MKITEFNPRSPLIPRLQAPERCKPPIRTISGETAVHFVYCVAFWFTRGADSFRGVLLETIVDLNLGQPKNGSKPFDISFEQLFLEITSTPIF